MPFTGVKNPKSASGPNVPKPPMDILVLKKGPEAFNVAPQLGLPMEEKPSSYYLNYEDSQWVVRNPCFGPNFVIRWDFKTLHEKLKGQKIKPKKDLLCRALGFKGESNFRVLDGTMGMGKDALHLVACGAHVRGVEQNPVTAFLLKKALEQSPFLKDQLEIFQGRVQDFLGPKKPGAQALYLDPMFEANPHKRASKKSLSFLQKISQGETDVQGVIQQALHLGWKRIVVKRPLKGPQFYGKPNHIMEGKLIRYDIYINSVELGT